MKESKEPETAGRILLKGDRKTIGNSNNVHDTLKQMKES